MSEPAGAGSVAAPTPVTIRRAAPADAAAFCRHLGDPTVVPGLLMLPYPSLESWQKRLTDGAAATNGDVLLIAERDGDLIAMWASGHPARRHGAAT